MFIIEKKLRSGFTQLLRVWALFPEECPPTGAALHFLCSHWDMRLLANVLFSVWVWIWIWLKIFKLSPFTICAKCYRWVLQICTVQVWCNFKWYVGGNREKNKLIPHHELEFLNIQWSKTHSLQNAGGRYGGENGVHTKAVICMQTYITFRITCRREVCTGLTMRPGQSLSLIPHLTESNLYEQIWDLNLTWNKACGDGDGVCDIFQIFLRKYSHLWAFFSRVEMWDVHDSNPECEWGWLNWMLN